MTESSKPWADITPGDAGPYSDIQWIRLYQAMVTGFQRDDAGILADTGNGTDEPLHVEQDSPASKNVRVRPGVAMVQGRFYESTATVETLPIASNNDPSDDRIDLICLEALLLVSQQTIRLKVVTGTPDPSPVAPTPVQTSTIWQIPLATVLAQSLFSTIVDADITITTEYARRVTPYEGGTGLSSIAAGEIIAGAAAQSFAKVAAPTAYDMLRYDSSAAALMSWYDQRPALIYDTAASSSIAAAWAAEPLGNYSDPSTDIVDTLTSNQLKLKAGTYMLIQGVATISSTLANTLVASRLQNVTAALTIAESSEVAGKNAAGNSPLEFYPVIFTMNGTDLIEWQFIASAAGSATSGQPGTLRSTTWTKALSIIRIGE